MRGVLAARVALAGLGLELVARRVAGARVEVARSVEAPARPSAEKGAHSVALEVRGASSPVASYIEDVFRFARAADPTFKLIYNEVGIERLGAKSDFAYQIITDLLDKGVPIDEVGFQSHVSTHRHPSLSDLRDNIRRFVELVLTVNISEVDARTKLFPGSQAERWHAQSIAFQQITAACILEPGCEAA